MQALRSSFRAAISLKIFASCELPSEKHLTPNGLLHRHMYTWEVWRALKKLELCFSLLSKLPVCVITDVCTLKHEPTVKGSGLYPVYTPVCTCIRQLVVVDLEKCKKWVGKKF